jgi:hypothetical protein
VSLDAVMNGDRQEILAAVVDGSEMEENTYPLVNKAKKTHKLGKKKVDGSKLVRFLKCIAHRSYDVHVCLFECSFVCLSTILASHHSIVSHNQSSSGSGSASSGSCWSPTHTMPCTTDR